MPLTRACGRLSRDRRDQRVAARAVAPARLAQVTIVGGGLEQPREHELVERRGAEIVEQLGLRDRVDQRRRQHQPAEPQARSERLGGGPQVHDAVGRQALQRSERRAVVAKLGVVVVLDHQAPVARPLDQRGATPAARARRPSGTGARALSAPPEHRSPQHRCPPRRPARRGLPGRRRRERHDAAAGTGPRPRSSRCPGAAHGPAARAPAWRRRRRRSSPARRRRRARAAGRRRARGAARARRARRGRRTRSPAPSAARRAARAATARAGTRPGRGRRGRSRTAARARAGGTCPIACRRGRRHVGAGALARDQIALGEQLRVGVDDQPPRDLQIARQRARGGQAAAGRQRAVAHQLAQAVLQLRAPAPAAQLDRAAPGRNWYPFLLWPDWSLFGVHLWARVALMSATRAAVAQASVQPGGSGGPDRVRRLSLRDRRPDGLRAAHVLHRHRPVRRAERPLPARHGDVQRGVRRDAHGSPTGACPGARRSSSASRSSSRCTRSTTWPTSAPHTRTGSARWISRRSRCRPSYWYGWRGSRIENRRNRDDANRRQEIGTVHTPVALVCTTTGEAARRALHRRDDRAGAGVRANPPTDGRLRHARAGHGFASRRR